MRDGRIIAIVGPTGAGKTALSMALAGRLGAEIVNLDSRQVYRGLDIGSAKPSLPERAAVPHHLFDVVDPDEPFDCARYRELARRAIADIQGRGKGVLLVGGTGLYLKVLQHGLFDGPPREPTMRAELSALEDAQPGVLHAQLAAVDPVAAARLHPHDRRRLIRALEVYRLTGRPMSEWQREHGFRAAEYDIGIVALNLDRAKLYRRIGARCVAMIEAGLVEEVRGLWARGYGPELESMRSIGYREVGRFLRGECSIEQAVEDMAKETRHLAKRQITWFRAVPGARWYDADAVGVADLVD